MKLRENQSKVIRRLVYGILYALAGMAVIILSPYGFGVLLLTVLVGGTAELYRIARRVGCKPWIWVGILAVVSLFGLNYDALFFEGAHTPIFLSLLLLSLPTAFICELFAGRNNPFSNLGATFLPLVYIALPISLLCNISLLIGGGEWSGVLMVAYLVLTWANDSFAYLVGISIGRHVMFPRISPKKSWEGLVGGLVGATLFGLGLAWAMGESLLLWGGMALIAAAAGVLGDLVESMFKRSVDLKDSGDVIPGHGGWLDRFDAFLISTPIVFVYLYLLSYFGLI